MKKERIIETAAQLSGSYEDFYREHYSKALAYIVKKIGHVSDAEDLAGDVFLYCYDHFREYDPQKSSISTWLYLVINSRIKNYYRSRRIVENIDDMAEYLPADAPEIEQSVFLEQLRQKLAEGLAELPERQRTVIIRHYFMGETYDQIARVLGMSAGNARVIGSRALDNLEAKMKSFY